MKEQQAAENIVQHTNAVYVSKHKYLIVDAREFKHLDLAFYDRTQKWLESQGFRLICDIENLTLAEAPGGMFKRLFLRSMTSADGNISAAIYHPKIKSIWWRILLFILGSRRGRIIDLETEFTDGTFLCTSNAMSAGAISLPSEIDAEHLPYRTSAEALLQKHIRKLEERLKNSKAQCRPARTYDETIAMQDRMQALKSEFRKKVGGVTKGELDRIAPRSKTLNADLHREMEKINEADRQ